MAHEVFIIEALGAFFVVMEALMRCEVLRPFQATNEALLEIGQIVDTAGWREESVLRLINQRYLRQTFAHQPLPGSAAMPDAVLALAPDPEPEMDAEPETVEDPVPILEPDLPPVIVVAAKPATVMDVLGLSPKPHRDTRR